MPGNVRQANFADMDMSGGMQNATSHLIRKRNEIFDAQNAVFDRSIGSAARRFGYEQVGQTIQYGNDSLYGGVYLYGANNKLFCGINDPTNAFSTMQYLDSDNYWKNLFSTSFPNGKFQGINYLDEFYIAGGDTVGNYHTLRNINSQLTVSTTNNVLNAPKSRFIAEYAGQLYAINVQVNGVTYRDRAYISSAPLGAITFVQTQQIGPLVGLHVDSTRYLKVGMSVDIYGAGTNNLKVQGLTIVSVDKANQRIGFVQTQISVNDNDEIWLSGRHNQLTTFWNTDYPTPQTSDWLRLPPGEDESATFTGFTVNNNRLFLFTKNSMWKWDGNNLVKISPVVGCISHETIQNISSWTIFTHTSGVWGFNDNTGQLKYLSRAVANTFRYINPSNFQYMSAIVSNKSSRVYKLAIGQLMDNSQATTSTSTSSTSTSSTSSSTSSTSTSSTSTSSTVSTTTSTSSTSSSTSSTSTSSTSSSTSSTSTSSTSSSSSTSTSSTTTTTVASTKLVTRLAYDFDLNIWWAEQHTRNIRFQFNHEMNGYRKPYFTDDNGYLFRDETGNNDAGLSIPMQIEMGRNNMGTEQNKYFMSAQIDSENARGGIVQYSIDNGDWQTLCQVKENVQDAIFGQTKGIRGKDINYRFVHNDTGDPPVFNGITTYFNIIEDIVNELGVRL